VNKSHNIANLTMKDRREIELKRQAALFAHNLKRGLVGREIVNEFISELDVSEQETFRGNLNKYRGLK